MHITEKSRRALDGAVEGAFLSRCSTVDVVKNPYVVLSRVTSRTTRILPPKLQTTFRCQTQRNSFHPAHQGHPHHPSPFTSPLKGTTTPKRPFQGSQNTPLSCRRRKFSKFANSRILSFHSEYGSDDARKHFRGNLCAHFNLLKGTGSPTAAKAASRNLRRSYHLRQLKRSSLHLEKRLVSQRIQEHEISLQALKERMLDLEEDIASSTLTVGSLHC
jgi:hypothetical protein